MRRAFESAHKSRFGFIDRAKAITIEAVSAEATGGAARLTERSRRVTSGAPPEPVRATRFLLPRRLAEGQYLFARGLAGRR